VIRQHIEGTGGKRRNHSKKTAALESNPGSIVSTWEMAENRGTEDVPGKVNCY